MLQKIWLAFIFISFGASLYQVVILGELTTFSDVMSTVTAMAKLSVDIAIGLIGLLAFWLGIFQIAEHSGLVGRCARVVEPLLCRLMPGIPRNHPAMGSITMNLSANALGLDNAATPFGIKAMGDMQRLADDKTTLTNAQILFLVLNTSAVTLFPITVFLYRADAGAQSPTDVFIPILLATSASTIVGVVVTALVQKTPLLNKVVVAYAVALVALLGGIIVYFMQLSAAALATQSALIANSVLFGFIIFVLYSGLRKGLDTYSLFIEGAKKGFDLAITLIPYLLAMLIAIGMLRASGVMDTVVQALAVIVGAAGLDTRFVDGLPTALMKPLSGSGARALMIETMQTHGADSFAGRLVSVLQGSTETTFYVLAVYLGAVGIKYSRYAVACCLAADMAGITTAILVSYWFFG